MIVAWCQIRTVHWMFQDFLPEVLQELSSHIGTLLPNIVMQKQNTFCQQPRAFLLDGIS